MPEMTLIPGDCLCSLGIMELCGEQFDAVVTDPPYHLTAGKAGGTGVASLNLNSPAGRSRIGTGFMGKAWDGGDVAFDPKTWEAVLHVMKPGAFMVAFASTRGYHRMVCAIEDAGFVIHPMLGWIFGTGFPKATRFQTEGLDGFRYGLQALKPAIEPICLAQKPREGTGTANWLAHGVGGLNIDACRIPSAAGDEPVMWDTPRGGIWQTDTEATGTLIANTAGRYPANVLHDGSDEVLEAFAAFGDDKGQAAALHATGRVRPTKHAFGDMAPPVSCAPRDQQGSAARFFYQAKASTADRAGSKHPTVKPLALMRWLCTLVCPPGGHILDPFAGSGTTLQAAYESGFSATGCERETEYQADITRRIEAVRSAAPHVAPQATTKGRG